MAKDFEEYFRGILDNLTGGLISLDLNGKVVYMNPMSGKILHLEETDKCVNARYDKAFERFPALKEVIKETLETGKTVRRSEISIMHANVPLIIGYSTLKVKNRDEEELGVAVIFQDISFVSASKK